MLDPRELISLVAVRAAISVRLWALREFHRRHPSPRSWGEGDIEHLRRLRLSIALLRERERHLHRKETP